MQPLKVEGWAFWIKSPIVKGEPLIYYERKTIQENNY